MPHFNGPLRILLAGAAVALGSPLLGNSHAQIGKVDGREAPCSPMPSISNLIPRFDLHSLCSKPLCPGCKRRYCPLDSYVNYGYHSPRWSPFPGTTPSYTPKKKDVGISTPVAPPPEPETTGMLAPPPPAWPVPVEPPLAPTSAESIPAADVSVIPITLPTKPVIIPDIKPEKDEK
jgi:hypothetical protein